MEFSEDDPGSDIEEQDVQGTVHDSRGLGFDQHVSDSDEDMATHRTVSGKY